MPAWHLRECRYGIRENACIESARSALLLARRHTCGFSTDVHEDGSSMASTYEACLVAAKTSCKEAHAL